MVGTRRVVGAGALSVLLLLAGAACRQEATSSTAVGSTAATSATGSTAAGSREELTVFVQPTATAEQVELIRRRLLQLSGDRGVRYVDQTAALEEFRCLFSDQPDVTAGVAAADLPTSYRFEVDQDAAAGLRRELLRLDGVKEVLSSADAQSRTPSTASSGRCTPPGTTLR